MRRGHARDGNKVGMLNRSNENILVEKGRFVFIAVKTVITDTHTPNLEMLSHLKISYGDMTQLIKLIKSLIESKLGDDFTGQTRRF